jgi:hypothetical protein
MERDRNPDLDPSWFHTNENQQLQGQGKTTLYKDDSCSLTIGKAGSMPPDFFNHYQNFEFQPSIKPTTWFPSVQHSDSSKK